MRGLSTERHAQPSQPRFPTHSRRRDGSGLIGNWSVLGLARIDVSLREIRLQPADIAAITAYAYLEMLEARLYLGRRFLTTYTISPPVSPFWDPSAMAEAVRGAAQQAAYGNCCCHASIRLPVSAPRLRWSRSAASSMTRRHS